MAEHDGIVSENFGVEPIDNSHIRRVIHDVKNWISGINLFCEAVLRETTSGMGPKEAIKLIQSAASEATRLCKEILTEERNDLCPITTPDAASEDVFVGSAITLWSVDKVRPVR